MIVNISRIISVDIHIQNTARCVSYGHRNGLKKKGNKMRLIDAEELLLYLNDISLTVAPDEMTHEADRQFAIVEYSALQDVMRIIEQQPTAYDIDKVVKQLEAESEKYARLATYERRLGTFLDVAKADKASESYERAIEIVKGGGIDV